MLGFNLMRPTVKRIFMGVGSHGSVGSIDYMCISTILFLRLRLARTYSGCLGIIV